VTIKHVAAVLDRTGYGGAAQFGILVKAAYHADRRGVIRASQIDIADALGVSRRVVGKWYARFEGTGILDREHQGRYRFTELLFNEEDFELALNDLNAPAPKHAPGAEEEEARLRELGVPIAYAQTPEGMWPVQYRG
jgi:DNA-binding transcriptional ArsR family regulator